MKIFIVDDEQVSLKKMKKILSAYGDCETAEDGRGAITKFQQAIDEDAPL